MISSATISPCGTWRYTLTRARGPAPALPVWVMLNPSTADAVVDDPTIRSISRLMRAHDGFVVVNLFGWRSPSPAALRQAWRNGTDVIGPDNDTQVFAAVTAARAQDLPVVAAWGAHPMAQIGAARLLPRLQTGPLWCVGENRDGSPKHPLYVAAATPLQRWVPA